LWADLPASPKMMDPRYRDVKNSQIPEVFTDNGVRIRIICGEVEGTRGPVQDITLKERVAAKKSCTPAYDVIILLYGLRAMRGPNLLS
jgi:redox-sensitive bicupin YhaK (pirin superfamily)